MRVYVFVLCFLVKFCVVQFVCWCTGRYDASINMDLWPCLFYNDAISDSEVT
jgi:hypothetical protein